MSEDQYSNLTPSELVGRLLREHSMMLVDSIFSHVRLSEDQKQKLQEEYKEYYATECGKYNKSFDNPEKDIAPKLKFINRQWDVFKQVFDSRYVSRSYLSLLIEFRNQWAHNDPLSLDEVVYIAETINRLAHIVQDYKVIQDVQGMIEYIESQKANSILDQHKTSIEDSRINENEVDDLEFNIQSSENSSQETTDESDYSEYDYQVENTIPDPIDRLALKAIITNEENIFFDPDPGDVYETFYAAFFHDLSEGALYLLDNEFQPLVDRIQKDQENSSDILRQDLKRLAELINNPNDNDYIEEDEGDEKLDEADDDEDEEFGEEQDDDVMIGKDGKSTCTEGKYPDTLYFNADSVGFALGSHKLLLIILNRKILEEFINNQLNDREYLDYYKGNPVICIPSVQNAEIRMGKNRAKIILDQFENIVKWLYKNNNLGFLEDFLLSYDE